MTHLHSTTIPGLPMKKGPTEIFGFYSQSQTIANLDISNKRDCLYKFLKLPFNK